ncbi:hypothetical protein P7K49_000533 [Saguinus oedipus]|uniref:Uncharacterized protein n=1 Tax=Saguinus oedipus TaxID=9490 RepID=A0ABQ9WBX7_SAGOE|nr:hypothetical protein P7K49_000533 [Saguinus oedipus]
MGQSTVGPSAQATGQAHFLTFVRHPRPHQCPMDPLLGDLAQASFSFQVLVRKPLLVRCLCFYCGPAAPSHPGVLHHLVKLGDESWLPLNFLLMEVAQSIEDHHQEVIGFCRENGFHGLVAYDSDYALCNIPYYFSAHALKLSRNGKSLTTSQYLMHEVAKQLDLNPNRFPIFAALLEESNIKHSKPGHLRDVICYLGDAMIEMLIGKVQCLSLNQLHQLEIVKSALTVHSPGCAERIACLLWGSVGSEAQGRIAVKSLGNICKGES